MEFRVIIGAAMIFSEITMMVLGKPASKNSYFRSDPRDNAYSYSFSSEPVHFDDKIRPTYDELYSPKTADSGSRHVVHSLNVRPRLENLSRLIGDQTHPSSARALPKLEKSSGSECPRLRLGVIVRDLVDILSPEIVSQADPFRYLVEKSLKLTTGNIPTVRMEVDRLLRFDRFPKCYMPYAKALSSLLQCLPDVILAKRDIRLIQILNPANVTDLSFLPAEILSSMTPELLQLFSEDFLADPKPPLRVFYSLVDTQKSSISNLEPQLENFIERTGKIYITPSRKHYINYARAVKGFLQNKTVFNNLKHEMAKIHQTETSDGQLVPATSILLDSSATEGQEVE